MIGFNEFKEELSVFIIKALIQELKRQGHVLTKALIESLDTEVSKKAESIDIDFMMLAYGRSLNDGISRKNIPYTIGGERRGGTSRYIQGLIQFALKRFTADKKEATSIAFAIANKHKRQGYPLTGKIGFIDNILGANKEAIEELIADYFYFAIEQLIEQELTYRNGNQ